MLRLCLIILNVFASVSSFGYFILFTSLLLGLTFTSAAIALTTFSHSPILISYGCCFRSSDPAIQDAAKAWAWHRQQVLQLVVGNFPLALPVIIAGIKTATRGSDCERYTAAFVGVCGED
jgi:ABC-type proline/glycine betaine transport system permease subunit